MSDDDARQRAVIADMRQLEREQTVNAHRPHEWTEDEVRQIFEGNAEIDRLTKGDDVGPEIQRYLNMT